MFGVSWLKVGLGLVIVLIVLSAVAWVLQPLWAARANKSAAAHVTAVIAEAKPKEAAKAVEVNAKASNKIAGVEARARVRGAGIVGSPDPDRAFYAGVCDGELYKADPQCRK